MTSPNTRASFPYVQILSTVFILQMQTKMAAKLQMQTDLLQHIKAIILIVDFQVQSFLSPREGIDSAEYPCTYRIIIHVDWRMRSEKVWRHNGPTTSEDAVIVSNANDETVRRRETMLRRIGELDTSANEFLEAASANQRSLDSLSYILLMLLGTDWWHIQFNTAIQQLQLSSSLSSSKTITTKMFYGHYHYTRLSDIKILHEGCELPEQYIVNEIWKIDSEKLSNLRKVQ